jgi:hypothetical protein
MKTRGIIGLIGGILLLLSSLAHAFVGWPLLRQTLETAGNAPDTIGATAAGWLFGSVAMAAFGVIVTIVAVGTLKGKRPTTMPAAVIAAAYLLFGVTAFIARDLNPHFLLFVATGVLVGVLALPTAARS